MPWVRMHGVKDYFDIPEVLHEFPQIKQTFNFVPSLHKQLADYISGEVEDQVQRLTKAHASDLSDEQKRQVLRLFFMANVENLIKPYPRYWELYERSLDIESALKSFEESDWRDIQSWYNLTWIGPYSREHSYVQRYFDKGRDFTETEKLLILEYHIDILKKIDSQHRSLERLKQIELSVSPMYHPILPLLCNSRSALEAMPRAILPEPPYVYPQDANAQITNALQYFKDVFGTEAKGMWPSEGSISDEALELMIENGIKWTASDEMVLTRSLVNPSGTTQKFFPHEYKTSKGSIALLFRDHFLSDRIGFVYSQWKPWDAANDFTHHLHQIRNEIIRVHGDEGLKYACVSVILDGENCWEYYEDNGRPFLKELFSQLTNMKEFKTVTCSEAVSKDNLKYMKPLKRIRAGSWINADFKIWIGDEEDRNAWSMLGAARGEFEKHKESLSPEVYKEALEHIFIAEGSDWFWWYGPEHNSDNKYEFDILFRWHIKEIYRLLGLKVPADVEQPINKMFSKTRFSSPLKKIKPTIDGKKASQKDWKDAGKYDARQEMTSMHQSGEILSSLRFGSDDENCYFRFELSKALSDSDKVTFTVSVPEKLEISFTRDSFSIAGSSEIKLSRLTFAGDDYYDIKISKKAFTDIISAPIQITGRITTFSGKTVLVYPRQEDLILIM